MNKIILERFRTLIKKNRLAHAYLFIGPQGIGKSQTALAVAALAIGAEDESSSLMKRVVSGNHPDVLVVTRGQEESAISIDKIRELISRMQLRPFEAPRKVCIIKNIEDKILCDQILKYISPHFYLDKIDGVAE